MKDPGNKSFAVGALTITTLVIVAVSVFLVGQEQRFWEGKNHYRIEFTRTNGLQEGAPVALNGVSVGSVRKMRFPNDPRAQYVEVQLSVSSSVANRIRQDTVGRIQTLGMLGDKYVELAAGSVEAELLAPGNLIRSVDPVDYEAILGQSGDVVSNAIEVTALLRQVLNDVLTGEGVVGRLINDKDFGLSFMEDVNSTAASLESASARIDRLAARVEKGEGTMGKLLSDDGRVDTIIENLEDASADVADFADSLNEGQGTLARLVHDDQFAEETLDGFRRSSTSIAAITSKINQGEGTLGKLVNDVALYDGANSWVSGSSRGGFWKLLGRGLSFFIPGTEQGSSPPTETP